MLIYDFNWCLFLSANKPLLVQSIDVKSLLKSGGRQGEAPAGVDGEKQARDRFRGLFFN